MSSLNCVSGDINLAHVLEVRVKYCKMYFKFTSEMKYIIDDHFSFENNTTFYPRDSVPVQCGNFTVCSLFGILFSIMTFAYNGKYTYYIV